MGLGAGLFTVLTALVTRPGLGSFLGVVPALLLIRFLMGIFTAPLYPACGRMNANWFPIQQQGFVWGLVAAGAGVGSALSPSLFSWVDSSYGLRKSFGLAGVATATLALIWASLVRDHPSDLHALRAEKIRHVEIGGTELKSNRAYGGLRKLLLNRNVQLLSFGYLTVGYFEYIFFFGSTTISGKFDISPLARPRFTPR